ncbi:hypothetical protein [Lactiplantibacillus plantarum]|uniref:hypothetical protein n=1 Tax=Lactiplantibacillus plantarum TaxID=1590 RepID=UPI0007B55B4E|nr:hypothetical protein [Lactiplantibacillus plantarum]KZU20623.1 hypothetical protein Nizo2484_1761 [Lactiplantibacillus plantarum]KZU22651.1 hypothetical protein Nizo2485_2815 [Lactiplantibacillus plantarum]
MKSKLFFFSDRIAFLRRWWWLLAIGLVGGLLFGSGLRQFGSKTVYKSSVALQVYHLKSKSMSKQAYIKQKKSELNDLSKYSVVVKSYDTIQAVNDSLHYYYGVWINNVDLGQMFDSSVAVDGKSLTINCISSSKELSRYGVRTMARIIKMRIKDADESMNVSFRIIPGYSVQYGNTDVIFYSGVVGVFIMCMVALGIEFGGLNEQHDDHSESKRN